MGGEFSGPVACGGLMRAAGHETKCRPERVEPNEAKWRPESVPTKAKWDINAGSDYEPISLEAAQDYARRLRRRH